MQIHWLADAFVAGVLFVVAWLAASVIWPGGPGHSQGGRTSRLRAALEGSRTGTWLWDLPTGRFFCDGRACNNLSAPSGAILTLHDFLACVAPSDRQNTEYQLQRVSESDQPFAITAHILTPEGQTRYVELRGQPEIDPSGIPRRISGALRDVTEERLHNIELRRQTQIFSQVHDAVIATKPDGRILSWNAGAERTFGYKAADVMDQNLQDLWFEEDRHEVEEQISAASLASGAHEFISRVRHESGAALYAHFRFAVLRDARGQDVGFLACSHDVTRQREEHEMLSLQARALESIRDAVLVTNKMGSILLSNAAALELFQQRGAKLAGLHVSSLLAGSTEVRAQLLKEIRAALDERGHWSGVLRHPRIDSSDRIVTRTTITALDLASGPSWVWVQQDITEQLKAEAALRERERRFRNLADSAPIMVWMTDAEGASEYVNQAWLQQCGMTPEQASGQGWRDAIHSDDRLELQRLIDCRNQVRGPFETELRMHRPDGSVAYTLTRGAPRYEDGRLVGFIGSAVDITRIKRAEEERIAMEQHALKTQKLQSLGVLAGGIAHDFNNMLVSVLGFSDLALHELEPGHPARELVEQIELGSRRAAALVQQVLTFAGKAERASKEVDVSRTVKEMAKLLERTVGPKVAIDLELDTDLPLLISDPGQISQVVMNLVLNASDALGEDGGRIRVQTSRYTYDPADAGRWIEGENLSEGEYIKIEVHDSGCGMDDPTLSQVFDPFFTTKHDGRGLGLSAVMGVVRSHAGALQVESSRGHGSSFRVLLPVSRLPTAEPSISFTGERSEAAVMVVDDDPAVLNATSQMLQSGGLRVFCARSEAEAVAIFEKHADLIRLVILDVVMPDATAARVAAKLHAIRHVRILLVSGYSSSAARPSIDGRTFVGFLPKPYTRARLLAAVESMAPEAMPDAEEDAASA